MVLYEGKDLYYLYDVGTLNGTELRGNKAVHQPVGLEEYLSGSENGVKLGPKLYGKLTAEEAANALYVAIRRQDSDTMRGLGILWQIDMNVRRVMKTTIVLNDGRENPLSRNLYDAANQASINYYN